MGNAEVINSAFDRFKANVQAKAILAMCENLDKAMKYALEEHDETHQNHLEVGDSYGWCLVYGGNIIKTEIRHTGNDIGGIKDTLESVALGIEGTGFKGVVMAGLNPSTYFAVDYEMDVLKNTADFTRQEFDKLFTKI